MATIEQLTYTEIGARLGVTAEEKGRIAARRVEVTISRLRAAPERRNPANPASEGGPIGRHPVDIQPQGPQERPVAHRSPTSHS